MIKGSKEEDMAFNHCAVINKNEEKMLHFYRDILGFAVDGEFMVPAPLAEELFGYDKEFKVTVFKKEEMVLEVFLITDIDIRPHPFNHFCLNVEDLYDFLGVLKRAGVDIIVGHRKDRIVHFIKDPVENLIELKDKE